jgi:hypothetical protein
MAAPKKLVGPAAVKELQKQVSKAGVKKSEVKQKQAIDKKYPGLYKDNKANTTKTSNPKESTTLSPKEKAGLKKGVEKIVSDSKKKAKLDTQKAKAPKTNWISKL